jgi:hypothetical protein
VRVNSSSALAETANSRQTAMKYGRTRIESVGNLILSRTLRCQQNLHDPNTRAKNETIRHTRAPNGETPDGRETSHDKCGGFCPRK